MVPRAGAGVGRESGESGDVLAGVVRDVVGVAAFVIDGGGAGGGGGGGYTVAKGGLGMIGCHRRDGMVLMVLMVLAVVVLLQTMVNVRDYNHGEH